MIHGKFSGGENAKRSDFFEAGADLVGVGDAQGRVAFEVPDNLLADGRARASLEGFKIEIVVSYDVKQDQRKCFTDPYEGPICPHGKHCGANGACEPDPEEQSQPPK